MRVNKAPFAFFLLLAGFAAYSNSFHAPFIFDDNHTIAINYGLRDLTNLKEVFTSDSPGRPFLMLTFGLNFAASGINTFGYHVVNFLIHFGSAWLVFLIIGEFFKREGEGESDSRPYAMLGALYFILHPMNVEAVTYVSSRSSSLSTMFYLLVFYLYMARPAAGWRSAILCGSLFTLAMLTKETPATLPAILTIFSFQFFTKEERKGSAWTLAAIWLVLPLIFIYRSYALGFALEPPNPEHVSPQIYFFTQLYVVGLLYIPKLFVPVNQVFDGHFPWMESPLEPGAVAGGLILALLVLFALLNFNKRRVLSFSILWFLSALTVTSSFLPIYDSYYERRLYLALPAVSLALVQMAQYAATRFPGRKRAMAVAAVIVLFSYGTLTFKRNSLHAEPMKLWQESVDKKLEKYRVYPAIAMEYIKLGDYARAESTLTFGLKAFPDETLLRIAYCWILGLQSKFVQLEREIELVNAEKPADRAKVITFRGLLAGEKGQYAEAERFFHKALELYPDYSDAWANLGVLHLRMGKRDEALALFEEAIGKYPYNPDFHYQLGKLLAENDRGGAFREFNKALELDPYHNPTKEIMKKLFR
jgi:tetratricopeptide (TPR) repeat protein